LANIGSHNSGSYNVGDTNSGGSNIGDVNTGWGNLGGYNTGLANSGDTNTGAFNSGDSNNGILERGNNRGQFPGFDYTITIPQITVTTGLTGLDLPITLTIGGPTLNTIEISGLETGTTIPLGVGNYPFTTEIVNECFLGICIPVPVPVYMQPTPPGCTENNATPFCPSIFFIFDMNFGPILIGGPDGTAGVTQNGEFTVQIGGPDTTIGQTVTTAGSTVTLIDIPASGAGFGNTTSSPSSGFFNSGAGAGSGLYNSGGGDSGAGNSGTGNSGFANVGGSLSGVANANTNGSGSQGSGVRNTVLESVPAMVSGVGNVASADGDLAGWFVGATAPTGAGTQGAITAGTGSSGSTNEVVATNDVTRPKTLWDVLGLSDAVATESTGPAVTTAVVQPLTTTGIQLVQTILITLDYYLYEATTCGGSFGTDNYCYVPYTFYDKTSTSTITTALTFPASAASSSAASIADRAGLLVGLGG
jgi:PPE-repeat protein